ncbi:17718_t:CDS:10 [Acaulospora morrowiae]|uniref:17718_t:CDS:1 n=1 Tax=Acaulospora morrowiae TaxID=94023 RepID=A0A9N8YSF4_9GLOM|nr:17718_t:CDS:10 [Acaulospora morrowiae]
MPLSKSKKVSGPGKAIIRDRFKESSRSKNGDTILHTTELSDDASWKKLQSITQQRDLDEFLTTAQLAGTQFTAEKLNIKIVTNSYQNPFLLSADKEKETLERHEANKERLVIPRRPRWDKFTTPAQLEINERNAFLQWRRDLAHLQEQNEFLLTPFERNIEVWRQLWRVIERSDLIVQIVDARNPLFFRSTDLEKYVKEVSDKKKNLLLINKADLLTTHQRRIWADYLDSQGIKYTFFSATLAHERDEQEQLEPKVAEKENMELSDDLRRDSKSTKVMDKSEETIDLLDEKGTRENVIKTSDDIISNKQKDSVISSESNTFESASSDDIIKDLNYEDSIDSRIRICSKNDLISLLVAEASESKELSDQDQKLTVGLVGYPNVGKSSTINALVGEKRVSVSSTPGKTKHFQTIQLTPLLILCDCPGLVFPNFATTNADMVCNGVLPIDQLREHTGPATLVAQRIPKSVIEAIYGIKIKTMPMDEGGTGVPTAGELLVAYAASRGFTKSGHGNLDESRAARYILKDYVNGKLLFCHPPPIGIPKEEFNAEIHDIKLYIKKKKLISTPEEMFIKDSDTVSELSVTASSTDSKSKMLDDTFFGNNKQLSGPRITGKFAFQGEFNRVKIYPINSTDDANNQVVGKKSHKRGKKNIKNRNAQGYNV